MTTYLLSEPKQIYLLPAPKIEKPEKKDYFADFESKYLAKVWEKKRYRKKNSKISDVFQQIGQFASIACLVFIFLNSFFMVNKHKETFNNLAKIENTEIKDIKNKNERTKTISNLSDNAQDGTSYQLANKTAKNCTSDGLKWISLMLCFSSISGIKTATNKALKKSYKHLTPEQKKIVKLYEAYEQANKFLYGHYGFYETAKRLKNGQIDFNSVNERTLSVFEDANKTIEKYNKIDEEKLNKALHIFNSTQFTYSQSF